MEVYLGTVGKGGRVEPVVWGEGFAGVGATEDSMRLSVGPAGQGSSPGGTAGLFQP